MNAKYKFIVIALLVYIQHSVVFAAYTVSPELINPPKFFLTEQSMSSVSKIGSFVDLGGNKLTSQITLSGQHADLFHITNGDLHRIDDFPVNSTLWFDLEVQTEINDEIQNRTFRIVKSGFAENQVVAHRGAWKMKGYPHNSMASLKEAFALGCAGSEFDVCVSADSVPFVNHDAVYASYTIESTPADVLSTIRLPNNEVFPSLSSFLEEGMKQNKTKLVIEIKTTQTRLSRIHAVTDVIVAKVHEMKAEAWVEYIAAEYEVLKRILVRDPGAKVYYISGNKTPAEAVADKLYGLDYKYTVYQSNPNYITEAKNLGLKLNTWTVNSASDMDWFLEQKFDYISTDNPELLFERIQYGNNNPDDHIPVFGGGAGTVNDPYLIYNKTHMQSMHYADYTFPVYYKMMADVDMKNHAWNPVNPTSPYTKKIHFDGNGFIIRNLTVVGSSSYMSLFGVLCGSCRNLGVIDASVTSTGSGVGIIAGYAGLANPSDESFTALIENCYTTGVVRGTNAVGGIVGNIGKPKNTALTGVRNCYSTADVTATNATASARAGGIAGLSYPGGTIENCYATGKVTSNGTKGAGGIIGYSDTDIIRCVAMNDSVINMKTGNLGRIAAHMSLVNGIQTQGVDCWALEDIVVYNAGIKKNLQNLITGTVTVAESPYDGATKTKTFLRDYTNFETVLGWDFSSTNNVWSKILSKGFPVFQWMSDRDDLNQIDGHLETTGTQSSFVKPEIKLILYPDALLIQSDFVMQSVKIYNTTGFELFSSSNEKSELTLTLPGKGIYIIKVVVNNINVCKKVII